MGDVSTRRGRIIGTDSNDQGETIIMVRVPYAEVINYTKDLRALTRGSGSFTLTLEGYEPAPYDVTKKLVEAYEAARAAGLTMLHLCTPPISAAEVYTAVTGKADWTNELPRSPFDYDLRSRYAAVLGGSGDYLCTKEEELDDVTHFLREWRD